MFFNKTRALEMMQSCELDVLVAASPVNVTYFTDYSCWIDPLFKDYMMSPGASSHLSPMYGAFCGDGAGALVINPVFATNATDVWVTDLCTYDSSELDLSSPPQAMPEADQRLFASLRAAAGAGTANQALVQWLRKQGASAARIGIDMEGLHPQAEEEIRQALPGAQIKDCSNLIRMIRMVKSGEEIDLLETAARISEEAAMETLKLGRPGTHIRELVQCYREVISVRGADFDHYAYGVRGTGLATRVDYRLAEGDYLYVDYGCIYQGYFSDTGFTLAVGELPQQARDWYRALLECHASAVELVRPGAKSAALADAMQASLEGNGISGTFPHGHGVGLEVRDYPIIVPDNGLRIRDDCIDLESDLSLVEGMVINLEASIARFGAGDTHLEQSLLVTADGCRPLVPHDRSQPFVVG